MRNVTLKTTVKGGLPVIVEADVESCSPHEYPGAAHIDDMDVSFLSGHSIKFKLSKADEQKITDEVFAEWNRDRLSFHTIQRTAEYKE